MKPSTLEKLLARFDQMEPSDLQQLLARLIRRTGYLEQVFEALQEGVILLDAKGHITFLNRAAAGFFGWEREKAIGHTLAQQLPGISWKDLLPLHKTISRDLEVFYPENRFLNFYLTPIDHPSERQLGYVMLVRDLTHHRAEVEQTLETERLNALTLLAAGVAHEIGNPLNSIDIHLQLLNRKLQKLPPNEIAPLTHHVEIARAEIQRLDSILRQFLQAVRPSKPQREPVQINEIIQTTLQSLEVELEQRAVTIELQLAHPLPSAKLDASQIQQVFYNLIRNAFQSLKSHDGRILIATSATDFDFHILIEDNGCGISPENMGSVFEPYQTTKSNGSGLGLMIVRRIIREHGGTIEIRSQQNQGTGILVSLPRHEHTVRLLPEPCAPTPIIDSL